ncbi:hypothetical protein CS006_07360 [Bifidobacterium primatium]|uniref:Uncharacterized protein n=1 Tax=Bifidobacterium primatium TaxID=2045438 RepID=A0A2M9H8C6_9BIFI|nr:protein rep [Bifidobacterium primatium]PJM73056.1 hypothetical protein CS006_07360 [Bifidobacterium primatium]
MGRAGIRIQDGAAYMAGLEHCASPWACPICTPIIRSARRQDLTQAVDYWLQDAAHGLSMATLTTRHRKTDALTDNLDLIAGAWSALAGSQRWRRIKQAYGISHYVRAMEITWGPSSGWHAHLHVLLCHDRPLDDAAMDGLRRGLYESWAVSCERTGARRPSPRWGVDLRGITDTPDKAAKYLGKDPDGRPSHGIEQEMARGDAKRGRGRSIAPFELLDDDTINGLGEARARHLWLEYSDAVYRRRSITWSRHLRKEAGIGAEQDDEQIINRHMLGLNLIDLTRRQAKQLRAMPTVLATVMGLVETGEVPLAESVIQSVKG